MDKCNIYATNVDSAQAVDINSYFLLTNCMQQM